MEKIYLKSLMQLACVLVLVFTLNSCILQKSDPKYVSCPTPDQNCNQTAYIGMAIDTARANADLHGYYINIAPVRNLSSENDEFSLSTIRGGRSLATINADGVQKLTKYRYVEYNWFEKEDPIEFDQSGHYGAISLGQLDEIAFSFQEINDPKKAHIFNNKLLYNPNDAIGKSRIYTGKLSGNKISDAKLIHTLDTNDQDVWEGQPAFGANYKVLFFASDRTGGIGGTDIWFMYKKQDGTWSVPFNCGPSINTDCDELTPFVDKKSNTLYFASMGHQSVGGYDLFSSKISDSFYSDLEKNYNAVNHKNFSSPVNLRPPLNTKADELFPMCDNCDSILYYSSNQLNKSTDITDFLAGFDMFVKAKIVVKKLEIGSKRKEKDISLNVKDEEIQFKEPEIEYQPDAEVILPKDPPVNFELFGKVENPETGEPIANAVITAKKTSNYEVLSIATSDINGNYTIELIKGEELEVTTQAENLFYDSFKINIDKKDTLTAVHRDLKPPKTLVLRINFPYDEYLTPYPFSLDSNGYETKNTWQGELDLLAENIKHSTGLKTITIEGHTDDQAGTDYNKRLGQKRADFIKEELIKRNIDKSLIKTISAGKSKLLIQRESEDIEIYRKRLRRVTITKTFK